MIEIQTGLPGACKTLYTIDRLETQRRADEKAGKVSRPIFYVARSQDDRLAPGIVGLKLDAWTKITPEEWHLCPPNSIVVIDEAQKVEGFRPRPTSVKAPMWAEPAMETHRSTGIDLILICQHPSQLAVGIRRLCGRHLHAVRKFGAPVSTIHEWGAVKDNCDKSRADSQQHLYKFNKRAYEYYESAEVHTHKFKIPPKVLGLIAILALVPLLLYWGWRTAGHGFGSELANPLPASGGPVAGGALGAPAQPPRMMTVTAVYQNLKPRFAGLPYTAPAYDRLTQPIEAPYPASCISMGPAWPCRCFSQRQTELDVPRPTCEAIAKKGFFAYWAPDRRQPVEAAPAAGQTQEDEGGVKVTSRPEDRPVTASVADSGS